MDRIATPFEHVSSELNTLTHQLAYTAARTDIEMLCVRRATIPGGWYDGAALTDIDEDASADVERALRYLTHRGLIERHQKHPTWVKVHNDKTARTEPPLLFGTLLNRATAEAGN